MKIKSTVLHALAVACMGVGLLYGMGIEGELGQPVSDGEFITALVLVLAAVFFIRLGFAAQDAEEKASKKIHKEPQNTVKSRKKVG